MLTISTGNVCGASPNQLGQTGLIYMPDARVEAEGTLRFGYSYYDPYPTFWSSLGMFPRLGLTARYTRSKGVTAFEGQAFGDDKDKAFDAKLLLLKESTYWPAIAIGTQDFLGTKRFAADYITLNKQFGAFDLSLGYGDQRIDGIFGGLRYTPSWAKSWRFVAEYDGFDYANDPVAQQTGADKKAAGATYAIEYQWGWLGSQLSVQDGEFGLNAHVSIPLMEKEFIPKLDEPAVYTKVTFRPTVTEWNQDPKYSAALATALQTQGFKRLKLRLSGSMLELGLSQARISLIGRSVGRAVRTALLMGPIDARSIKITYTTASDLPILTYHFTDLELLDRFFSGSVTYGELIKQLTVTYTDPDYASEIASLGDIKGVKKQAIPLKLVRNEDGQPLSLKSENETFGKFKIIPFNIGLFFNDPSGAVKYELFSIADYQKRLMRGLFFNTSARLRLFENVSDVTQPSNSTLPHVRTDVADYKRENGLKLNTLLLNKFLHLSPRTYARLSVGMYEEMFGGAGGQILYLPKDQNWALDLTVDWLQQRDTEGEFEFRDYETVTTLAAFHYRFKSSGLTLTLRAGRFLAKDEGGRVEIMRRFRSGIKVGAWFTVTDGEDTTGPGSPDDPYYDKGIFMSIPLNTMLTQDTRSEPSFGIRPWTRDVGQMVASPGDLYEILDKELLLDRPDHHILSGFHF